jgi:hypothetical protein
MVDGKTHVFSIFEMTSRLGYFVPRFNMRFDGQARARCGSLLAVERGVTLLESKLGRASKF